MSLFVVIAYDAPNVHEKRMLHMAKHLKGLAELQKAGRLFTVGPMKKSCSDKSSYLGSLMIVDFADQQAADDWLAEEPFYVNGVYETVTITPFVDAMDEIAEAA